LGWKIDSLTTSALPYYNSILRQLAGSNPGNTRIVCDFITAEYNEQIRDDFDQIVEKLNRNERKKMKRFEDRAREDKTSKW
jgi:hypothetical protein